MQQISVLYVFNSQNFIINPSQLFWASVSVMAILRLIFYLCGQADCNWQEIIGLRLFVLVSCSSNWRPHTNSFDSEMKATSKYEFQVTFHRNTTWRTVIFHTGWCCQQTNKKKSQIFWEGKLWWQIAFIVSIHCCLNEPALDLIGKFTTASVCSSSVL